MSSTKALKVSYSSLKYLPIFEAKGSWQPPPKILSPFFLDVSPQNKQHIKQDLSKISEDDV